MPPKKDSRKQNKLKGLVREQSRAGNRMVRSADLLADSRGPRLPVFRRLQGQISRLVVVATLREPDFKNLLVDRFLAAALWDGIGMALVLNKADLLDDTVRESARRWQKLYESLDVPVLLVSARSGEGIESLRELIAAEDCALAGQSGVGKSSLINALAGGPVQRTRDLGRVSGKGQHTTIQPVRLQVSPGVWVWDLPGIKYLKLWDIPRQQVRFCFPEFAALKCRFNDCQHQGEAGCALPQAIEEGRVDPERVRSYLSILDESQGS